LNNSVVAGNSASGTGPDVYKLGGSVSAAYSLIGNTSGSRITAGNGNILNPASPRLGPLRVYGGTTPTIPPPPGSPAIDSGTNALAVDANGDPLLADQRGQPRISNDTVDIGAFESQGFTITATTGSSQSTAVNTDFGQPLAVTVIANNSLEPVD